MGQIFNATNSYNTSVAALVERASGNASQVSGSTDIQFNHASLIANLSHVRQIDVYIHISSLTEWKYNSGLSVTNKIIYPEFASSSTPTTGWLKIPITNKDDFDNFVGSSDYYTMSHRCWYSGDISTLPNNSTVVRSTLEIGTGSNKPYIDVEWEDSYYTPTVSNLNPVNTTLNPNVANTLSWGYSCPDGTTQQSYVLEWKNGVDGAVNTITGGEQSSYITPSNTFPSGSTIYWRVKATSTNAKTSAYSDWVSFATHIAPTITSLEPNLLPQNRENQIILTWDGTNYDAFTLLVKQNNTTIKTFTGTVAKQAVLEPLALIVGTATLELTVTKTGSIITATRTSTFEVYGKPNLPILDLNTVYNTSLPVFTWSSAGQMQYNLEIRTLSNVLVETITQNGDIKSYKTINNLANNTDYIVKLRIKNVWDLWSDYATKQIRIEFVELSKPSISVYLDASDARLEVTAPFVSIFAKNTIYRKTDTTDWVRISNNLKANDSVTDYTIADNIKYYYKVRSVGKEGEIADSDVVSILTKIKDYVLTDMTNPVNEIYINSNPSSKFTRSRNTSYSVFAGCTKPTVEVGRENYIKGNLSFFVERSEYDACIDMITKNTILCLRDYMGKQLFIFVVGDVSDPYEEYLEAYNISFNFVEIDFNIQDMLFTNGLSPVTLVYLDGKYKLDGSINLSGVL